MQLFHHLFEEASLGIAVEDLDGKILLANPALCSMLGYQEAELCAMSCSEFANPEDSQDDWALFQQLRAGVIDQYSLEKRYERKDGAQLWGRLNVSLFKDRDGGLAPLVFAFVEDITERKRAEEALRESDERFHLAAQAAKMYAFEWDVATDVVVRSKEFVEVLGCGDPGRQLTRRQLIDDVHPDDRASLARCADQPTLQNPTTKMSYRVLRPDGSAVWVEKCARAIFDEHGKVIRMIGMVADITERKRAEQGVRESEERFRRVANSAPVMIWMSDPDMLCTYFNQPWLEFTGRPIESELGDGWAQGVHPEDLRGCLDAFKNAFDQRESFKIEYRLRRHDGEYCWILDTGVPRFNPDGSFAGYIGSCLDVTDRKLAEAALASVNGKLIEAQEQEWARIGRELHDDIGQRVALLAIQLQQLEGSLLDLPEVRGRIAELQKQTFEIAADVQSLSHELHLSKLQYLGISAAMKSFCQEFARQQKVEVDFQADDQFETLPPDVSLCFFRVLQEALHNAAKHSGTQHFEVRLWRTSEVHLTVSDFGKGFDPETAKGKGLGLISMEERLKLLNGTFSIESQPQRGTKVHARVPFSSEKDSFRSVG
ncbi:MAG: PAS domain S-box protein [Terracidiphilus sp.]